MNSKIGTFHNNQQILLVSNQLSSHEIDQICKMTEAEGTVFNHLKLSLVHVIPPTLTHSFSLSAIQTIKEHDHYEAKQCLALLGKRLKISKKDQWLIIGQMSLAVLRLANQLGARFILASSEQIKHLQQSLLFNNIQQYLSINHLHHLQQAFLSEQVNS